jgi:hypothetical protein
MMAPIFTRRYARIQKYTSYAAKMPALIVDRTAHFWTHVSRGEPDDCWNWTGFHVFGYGRFWDGTRKVNAMRYAWIATNGPIEGEMDVCHACDNRSCCNPAHLFLGTRADNLADMTQKKRRAVGAKHGRSKLTLDQVNEIRERCAAGANQTHLGQEFGVDRVTIWKIHHGRLWRDS